MQLLAGLLAAFFSAHIACAASAGAWTAKVGLRFKGGTNVVSWVGARPGGDVSFAMTEPALKAGDKILRVNRFDIASAAAFESSFLTYARYQPQAWRIEVERDGKRFIKSTHGSRCDPLELIGCGRLARAAHRTR